MLGRGVELLTGSRARSLAREIKDIETQKNNLNFRQRVLGKGSGLNRLQKQKYNQFDTEARNVDLARKSVLGTGALAISGSKLANRYKQDQQVTPVIPVEDNVF